MIPILYEKNETAFVSNGICRLPDCLSCEVTEERNGLYELDFSYPVTGTHFKDLIPGRIIGVTHDDSGDIQPFDIVGYTRTIDGQASFHAVHISYRLSYVTATGSTISSLADALSMLSGGAPDPGFSYTADFTASGYMSEADGLPHTVKELLGGAEGSILDTYGGEYTWDRFQVILRKNRGVLRDFSIRYGINMTNFSDDMDCSGVYNACVPYYKGNDTAIIGNKVTSGQATFSGMERCIPLDLSDKFETQPTKAQLEAEALSYLQKNETANPTQNISVSFVRLQDFAGSEELSGLMQCGLCDRIMVEFPTYDMKAPFKIVKTVWNALEDRYTEMELGSLQPTLKEAMGL